MGFRNDFVWGAATASYQVEGAAFEGDKGLNIWDVFCRETNSNVYKMHNGDVACDQFHRFPEDVSIMKDLGIKAYRFSVDWARVMPGGFEVSAEGLSYYDRLVDALIDAGIEPYMTLYHWDLPFELQLKGGWLNSDIVKWFEDYTRVLATHFKGRVKNFFTINEMQCILGLGYYTREQAPGWVVSKKEFFCGWKNILMAHGTAVRTIREACGNDCKVGLAANGTTWFPKFRGVKDNGFTNNSLGKDVLPEDIEAAKRLTFEICNDNFERGQFNFGLFADPICLGKLPEGLNKYYGDFLPEISNAEMDIIHTSIDYFALNIYSGCEAVMTPGGPMEGDYFVGIPQTQMGWYITPDCLYWAPKFIYERYKIPFFISENGMASHDWVALDGKVHDSSRVDFLHRYLKAFKQAADEGVDIRGYFQWSLLDNFEWSFGYSKRFGIVFVDYETLKRTPKDSAYFYRDVIKSNGDNL